jgi:hypothetical protein
MRSSTWVFGGVVCAGTYLLVGCVGELFEIKETPPTEDMAMEQPAPDLAEIELGPPRFFPDIQKDIDAKNCSAAGCHGGVQKPVLKANPTTQADQDANYTNFTADCDPGSPMSSLILQKSLGMPSHGGGAILTTTDPVYQRWLAWIGGGMLK